MLNLRLQLTLSVLVLIACQQIGVAAEPGYHKEVTVSEATRLDWSFVLTNQSLKEPPAEWLRDYDSKTQKYECYIPEAAGKAATGKKTSGKPKPNAKPARAAQGLPLILFISPSDQPAGWAQFQNICKQQNIIFASPWQAGNNVAMPRRVRIVLDVLDDLRRTQQIDPDRTYIGGFSGGGRTACGIGLALPELFGGIIPVCAGGDLREETWLRHRAFERLSLALITGTEDFNRGEVERFRGPMLSDMGLRTKITVVPKLGHAIPDAKTMTNVIQWLETAAPERRKLAEKYPASRLEPTAAPTREEWAASLLKEGQQRLKDPKTLYAGLMQIQGVSERWPDLPESMEAKQILVEYDAKPEHPWEADDIDEQRKFLIARARALTAYASGDLPDQYAKQRKDMLQAAINLWALIVKDAADADATKEGRKRLLELQERLNKE